MTPSTEVAILPEADSDMSLEHDNEFDAMFEEVDLFSTALIQGGCTDNATY